MLSDLTVVVDLAVDGKDDGVIGVGQGLSTRLWNRVSECLVIDKCFVQLRAKTYQHRRY